ncbi:MAG: riboflavin kinase [bacterium]|nr:riboflavin kinase [bacterium]
MKKISGKIVHGSGRGKQLGFSTANIAVQGKVPVVHGVYACWVTVQGKRYAAATSVGVNEMFGEKEPTIEAHILDFSGDIYGENVKMEFVKRLRAMERFDTVKALKEQIKKDVEGVQGVLRSASAHSPSLSSDAQRASSGIRPHSSASGGNRARSGS